MLFLRILRVRHKPEHERLSSDELKTMLINKFNEFRSIVSNIDYIKLIKMIFNEPIDEKIFSLSALKSQLSIPQLTDLMDTIGIDMEDFELTQEITSDGINDMQVDTAVTDEQVKEVLGEIDAEIGAEIGAALPTVDSDGKVKELEEELNKLKSRD